METVDPTDSRSSHGGSYYDDGSSSSSDVDDMPMNLPQDSPKRAPLKGVVPALHLGGVNSATRGGGCVPSTQAQQHAQQPLPSPTVVPLSVRGGEPGNTSIAVDLLSNAFRLKPETVQQAREWGWTLEQIIGTGFSSALDISKRNLHYYVVREVAWDEIADTCPQHIAVGIEGSSFTLGAVEDMLRKNRESQQIITQNLENIRSCENDLQLLKKELKHKTDALVTSENENRQLRRQLDNLRQALSQHHQMPSMLSASLVSPRLLTTGGGANQLRSPSAIARLRDLIAENQQLVGTLERLSGQDMWVEHSPDGTPGVAHRLDLPTGSA